MMRPCERPYHAVVAFWLRDRDVTGCQSCPQISAKRDEDWIFEIASITKVFAAILSSRLIEEGKIDPKAPVREKSKLEWTSPTG